MILEGLRVMLIGMSVVMGLLFLLVITVSFASKIIRALEGPMPSAPPSKPGEQPSNAGVVAAISAAIAHFKKNKGNQK